MPSTHKRQQPASCIAFNILQVAAKLATAALQKYRDSHPLRALKALALLRMDRAGEALEVCFMTCKTQALSALQCGAQ